nr:SGNH/GDSL hydrolase family protein [Allopusillimonas ginsengisoli]
MATGASARANTDGAQAHATHWVASWTASPQPVWTPDFAFPTGIPPSLENQTVRQIARISLGGRRLRLVFSNAYGNLPLNIDAVTVALSDGGSAIQPDSLQTVMFGGKAHATIPPGAPLVSDPVALSTPDLTRLAISIHSDNTTPLTTFHWDGRQTAWIAPGNQTTAQAIDTANTITARVLLTGIEVEATASAQAVAIIGDSITDGNMASLDADTRWPDFLAKRLAPQGVAVVNAGISGARLLRDGMGVNGVARFERDALSLPGVSSVIVLLGINDISWPGTLFAPHHARPTLSELTAGYRQLAEQAHRKGIKLIGATLTPFEGALPNTPLNNYYNADKNALRQQLNRWIRHSGVFDAVVDFDRQLRDPLHPNRLQTAFDSGDHLHPGDKGNRAMADSVPLETVLAPSHSVKQGAHHE